MGEYSLRRFVAITLIYVIVLAIAWNWIGKGYVSVLAHTLSSVSPSGVTVQHRGHVIDVTVERTMPTKSRPNQDEDMVGVKNVGTQVSSGEPGAHTDLNGMAISYGLIPALALLLAVPSITLKARLLCILGAILVGFIAHLAGPYLLVQRLVSVVQDGGSAADAYQIANMMSFFLLFAPSLVWVPVIFVFWRRKPSRLPHSSGV